MLDACSFNYFHERKFYSCHANVVAEMHMKWCSVYGTLTKDNTTSNNTSDSSKLGATQFSIGSFELVY